MEKSINEIYDDLVDTLIEAYVFYVPREVVWQEMLDHLEGKIEDDFFDVCHVVVNGQFGDADLTKFQSLQFEKVKRLEKNFFELLRLQRVLSEQEFHILITKYLDYVEFLASIAKWLLENLAKYRNPEDDLDVNSIFNVQWNQFAHHFLELFGAFGEKHNYVITEFYTIPEFMGKYLPDFVQRYTNFVERFPFPEGAKDFIETVTKKRQQTKKPKKKKEKPVLITDAEADLFLLETVFNVKFD